MSNIIRLTVSVYIMVICIIIINLIAGADGLIPYKELTVYKDELSGNIDELMTINQKLQTESDRLIHDSDEIKIKARELGWIDYDEGVIVVKGYKFDQSGYSMGKLLSHEKKYHDRSNIYRIFALLVGILFYLLSGFFWKE